MNSARFVALEDRHQELGADVHRERRPVALGLREPARDSARLMNSAKSLRSDELQRAERFGEARLVAGREPHFPAHQLDHQLDPLAPRQRRAAARLELAEAGDEVAREALLADAVALEEPRDDREDLARVHRLHEVVVHLDADRLAQRRLVLALRHHHDRHRGVDGADLAQQLEAAAAGHLLVEQHDASTAGGAAARARRRRGRPARRRTPALRGSGGGRRGRPPRHRPRGWSWDGASSGKLAGRRARPATESPYLCRVACLLLVRFSSIGDVLLTTPLDPRAPRPPSRRPTRVRHQSGHGPARGRQPASLAGRDARARRADPRAGRGGSRRSTPRAGSTCTAACAARRCALLVRCPWRGYAKRKLARGVLVSTKIDLYGRARPRGRALLRSGARSRRATRRRPARVLPRRGGARARRPGGSRERDARRTAARGARARSGALHQALAGGALDRASRSGCASGATAIVAVGRTGRPRRRGARWRRSPRARRARARCRRPARCWRAPASRSSGDTGVMHMATGVGTPVVALFGPTVEQFGFFPYRAKATVLQRDLDCRPCSPMGGPRCPDGPPPLPRRHRRRPRSPPPWSGWSRERRRAR